ncbi:MAG: 30S ribosome-binding factor RbfA [Ruminococcaceae bacterium]|nr:30S ribosome-binding factor RbfA [Oscillospiraceae bacterium]
MANYRRDRINDEMLKEVAIVLREVKDPRVARAFVSVTAAEVTPDLKYAKIYYSFLGESDPKEVAKGLKTAAGFIRGQIARNMNLRITPEFTFIHDNSIKHGAHIATLLEGITFSDDEAKANEDGED